MMPEQYEAPDFEHMGSMREPSRKASRRTRPVAEPEPHEMAGDYVEPALVDHGEAVSPNGKSPEGPSHVSGEERDQ